MANSNLFGSFFVAMFAMVYSFHPPTKPPVRWNYLFRGAAFHLEPDCLLIGRDACYQSGLLFISTPLTL